MNVEQKKKQQLSTLHPITIFLMPFDIIWEISCQTHSSLSLWQALSFASNLMAEYLELLPRKWNPLQRHPHHQLFIPCILSFLFQGHSHYPDENMEHHLYLQIFQSPSHNLKTFRRHNSDFFGPYHLAAPESEVGNGWRFHEMFPYTLYLCSRNTVPSKHATPVLRRESPHSGNAQVLEFFPTQLWLFLPCVHCSTWHTAKGTLDVQ